MGLHSVVIVEDEMLVRMGLKNAIDWQAFNMQVIADVADGEAALEIYEKEKPDLIITDLRMPGMGGMELIARIRERDKQARIIILTCLEEFDLVRKAISLGVSDYILKLTMTVDQIKAVLANMQEELDAYGSKPETPIRHEANGHVIKEKLMKDFILYNGYSAQEFTTIAQQYGFQFKPEQMLVCVLEIDHYARIQSLFKDTNGQLVKHTMLNVLDELLSRLGMGEAFGDDGARYTLIFSFGPNKELGEIYEALQRILKEIENPFKIYFNASVSFGMSGVKDGYQSLRVLYDQAIGALEDKFFGGAGAIYGMSVCDRRTLLSEKSEEVLRMCEKLTALPLVFISGYTDRLRAIAAETAPSKSVCVEKFCQLVQWTVQAMKYQEDGSEQVILSAIQSIKQSETLDDLFRYLYEFLSRIASAGLRRRIVSKEVKLAIDYMEQHYSSDLSLQQVSAHVALSPSYLSSLFKKEIDVNFVDYLNEIRIDKAKELLLETYLKTYEIAECTGFKENTYFCKMFKKVTGMTTGEYRRQWLSDQTEDAAE
ncbi:response regulator [Paenibacillus albus]|uniref:Response regulator n=1 Tax=Paenibacillus albus TaxID=2495582 RepID=A0A3S9AAY7_9BACL|nr:response regulator [Paenibacillus albus]AZN42874.1 response regulator [Paenibacillus albus]